MPEISDDKQSLTLEYDTPFVDWNLQSSSIDQPGPSTSSPRRPASTSTTLIEAILTSPRGDAAAPAPVNETLKAVADFWNTGFDMTSLPDDPSLYLSSGPFIVDSWEPTQSMTLVANENYKGDHKPAFSSWSSASSVTRRRRSRPSRTVRSTSSPRRRAATR